MIQPQVTASAVADAARLEELYRVALLDTPTEEVFDRFTLQASAMLGVPISLVTLVDVDRQFFKSCVGVPEPWSTMRETPLSYSFCQHAVAARTTLLIEDARTIPQVRDNLAVRDLGVVAYLGVPLITSGGHAVGSFCVIDTQPREWTDEDIALVAQFAAEVMAEIERRLAQMGVGNGETSVGSDG